MQIVRFLSLLFLTLAATVALAENSQTPVDSSASQPADHIKAKVLDGGNEVDGAPERAPSATDGLPYPDEELKAVDPAPANKNMPVDQD